MFNVFQRTYEKENINGKFIEEWIDAKDSDKAEEEQILPLLKNGLFISHSSKIDICKILADKMMEIWKGEKDES